MEIVFTALMAAVIAFVGTFILLKLNLPFLPKDGRKTAVTPDGKIVEVNSASRGKTTGVGLLFTLVWYIVSIALYGFYEGINVPFLINVGLLFAMTMAGYLDDRAAVHWRDLLKGELDLIIAIGVTAAFMFYNDTEVYFFTWHMTLHPVAYVALAIVMLWCSVNVTNCSDGVDGLCGGVTIVECIAFFLIFPELPKEYGGMALGLAGALIAYLCFNWFPSSVLMGDGGSRPIGLFLGMLAMQSKHPFALLLLSFVFIFDGGVGLVKVFLKRRFKIVILEKVRYPFHDQMRKNWKWNVPNTSLCAIGTEAVCSVICGVLVMLFG